jgi:hypothetical protein
MFRSYDHVRAEIYLLEITLLTTILTFNRRKTPLTLISHTQQDANALCEPIFIENVKASTSHNSMDLHGLLLG